MPCDRLFSELECHWSRRIAVTLHNFCGFGRWRWCTAPSYSPEHHGVFQRDFCNCLSFVIICHYILQQFAANFWYFPRQSNPIGIDVVPRGFHKDGGARCGETLGQDQCKTLAYWPSLCLIKDQRHVLQTLIWDLASLLVLQPVATTAAVWHHCSCEQPLTWKGRKRSVCKSCKGRRPFCFDNCSSGFRTCEGSDNGRWFLRHGCMNNACTLVYESSYIHCNQYIYNIYNESWFPYNCFLNAWPVSWTLIPSHEGRTHPFVFLHCPTRLERPTKLWMPSRKPLTKLLQLWRGRHSTMGQLYFSSPFFILLPCRWFDHIWFGRWASAVSFDIVCIRCWPRWKAKAKEGELSQVEPVIFGLPVTFAWFRCLAIFKYSE